MANKKINQLVSKTAILSTDIFGIGDATTGQLFKKTIAELQAAIGGAVISVNGLVGTVVLDTDDIQELATPTNKYFTDARARGAISLTVTGNSGASTYSSGTGVLNVPTYTLAGLGGITASFLSGTSGISYNSSTGVISYSGTVYTDSSIRALLSGSTGITYNSSTGAISYSGTVYTDSSIRALISITTTGNSGASTYNNTTGVINVPEYTLAGLGGISLTSLSGGTGITYNNTTGAISYSGTVYTDASVRALISASGAVSYNNTTGVISLTGGNLTEATSSVLTITGGTGAVLGSGTSIQVKQATTSVSGFLSSTDWNTFNGKANALSGTTNYVAKFTSGTGIGNSAIYDDGTSIGIGATTNLNFGVATTVGISVGGSSAYSGIQLRNTTGNLELFVGGDGATDAFIRNNMNGNLRFGTNGNEKIRITSAGNIGVNTSTPTSKLEIYDNSNSGILRLSKDGGQQRGAVDFGRNNGGSFQICGSIIVDSDTASINNGLMYFYTSNSSGILTERMRISAGRVLIGTTTDNTYSALQVVGTTWLGADVGAGLFINSTSTLTALVGINKAVSAYAKMELRASGTDGQICLHTNGNNSMGTLTDGGYRLYVSGAIYATGNITANSDLRLKKNLQIINNPIGKLMELNGYSYQWKADDEYQYGVIAQEVEKILPYAVSTCTDGIKGVSYNQIIPVLIEAVKEQKTKIENLEILLASK